MSRGFAVDVPIVNLDEDVDDLGFEERDGDNGDNFDDTNRSIDLNNIDFRDDRANVFTKSWYLIKNKFSGKPGFTKLTNHLNNYDYDIELWDRNGHNNIDFEYDFGIGYNGRNSDSKIRKWLRFMKAFLKSKILVNTLLFLCTVLFLTLVILVSIRNRKSISTSPTHFDAETNPILENADSMERILTIVISIGSLHPHFISSDTTPYLNNLLGLSTTIYAPYLIPQNPSSNFPNLWSISTGLTSGNHGIISDLADKALLEKAETSAVWNDLNARNLSSYLINWPTAELNENFAKSYREDDKLKDHLTELKKILGPNKEKREHGDKDHNNDDDEDHDHEIQSYANDPSLIMLHTNVLSRQISKTGKVAGKKFEAKLKEIDSFIESIYKILNQKKILDSTNVIITSTGDYVPVSKNRLINLDELVDYKTVTVTSADGNPIVGIYREDNHLGLYNELKAKWQNHLLKKHFSVEKGDKMGFKMFDNVDTDASDLVLIVPDVGYAVYSKQYDDDGEDDDEHEHEREHDHDHDHDHYDDHNHDDSVAILKKRKAASGYMNNEMLMRNVFVGTGPYFGKANLLKPFDNIQIFNMICGSLNVDCSSNDGDEKFINDPSNMIVDGDWSDNVLYPGVSFDMQVLTGESFFEEKFADLGSQNSSELNHLDPIVAIPVPNDNEDKSQQSADTFTDGSTSTIEQVSTDFPVTPVQSAISATSATLNPSWWQKIEEHLEETVDDVKQGIEDFVQSHVHKAEDSTDDNDDSENK